MRATYEIEVSSDPAGAAVVLIMDCHGAEIREGAFDLGMYFELQDASTAMRYWAVELVVDGDVFGLVTRLEPRPGASYFIRAQIDWSAEASQAPDLCGAWMTSGTLVQTDEGEHPVEWLEAGMRVVTRDHGLQPLEEVLRSTLGPGTAEVLVDIPQAEELGKSRDDPLIVSPDTLVLLRDPQADLYFGDNEVLFRAASWEPSPGLEPPSATLTGLVFARHELVMAGEGVWLGSWLNEPQDMAGLMAIQRIILLQKLGVRHHSLVAARQVLTPDEAALVCPARGVIEHTTQLSA